MCLKEGYMQIQRVQNNQTNFSANLKVHNNYYKKMEKPVVDFLEKQFPKKTKDTSGQLDLYINGDTAYIYKPDVLAFDNGKGYKDSIDIDLDITDKKDTILNKLVNSLKGFSIREKAQNEINELKGEIIKTSDKAYHESAKEFRKSFSVYERSLSKNDIDKNTSPLWISVFRGE